MEKQKENTTSIGEISNKEGYFTSKGSIVHIDSDYVYILHQGEGLKQEIEIFKKDTMQAIKKIDLREQNFSALDSNDIHIAIVYRKGITEIWDKATWNLLQNFTYNTNGIEVMMNDDMLLVSIYGQQSAVYTYNKEEKNWKCLGYPQLHTSPFQSVFYHNNLVYTGAMYEEILISSIKPNGFKKIEFIDTCGRYVDCIKVDDDYIYHHCEGFMGVYDKTKKEISDDFEDYYSGNFDIDERYLYYSIDKGIVIREKKSWNIIYKIDTENKQANDVFVDDNSLFFDDNEGNFHQIPKIELQV
ncbi:MAG: hypothetical protein KGD63_06330 [Candidatus Lokiarchaeota archaeon]|nr:hypothetical protein [Candidatus Lokiarchaeota archaeon]